MFEVFSLSLVCFALSATPDYPQPHSDRLADRTLGALVPFWDTEGLYVKSSLRSGPPGVSRLRQGHWPGNPGGTVKAQEMLVEPQGASISQDCFEGYNSQCVGKCFANCGVRC